MTSEWQAVLLGDVAEYLTVGHVGSMVTEYVEAGIPFLRSQDILPFRIDLSDTKYISPGFHAQLKKSALRPGDVVIVRTGKPGAAAVVPHELPVANCSDLVIVRPGPRLESRFLCYYINEVSAHHVNSHLVGAVQQHFNVSSARMLPLKLPPLAEQSAIATLLGSLDDKIELNKRMSETIEVMARALFTGWFVDFEPVRAKMDGRIPFGMDSATAALFPSSFKDAGHGSKPLGWVAAPLNRFLALQRGTTYESRLLGAPGPVLLGLGSILPGGGFRGERLKTYGGENPEKLLLRPGEMYVALKGATKDGSMVGSVARVPPSVSLGRLTQDTVKLELNEVGVPAARYLYWALRTSEYRDYCAQRATGSAQVGLSRADFLNYVVLQPHHKLLAIFSRIDEGMSLRVNANEEESLSLAALRDLLLPKLLSGELRIRDADKAVEAAL